MRALLISTLALGLLIGCWYSFYRYSDATLHHMVSSCEEQVMPAIESGHWETAMDAFDSQYQEWHRYKKLALFILETDKVNDTDLAFAKTRMYIKACDLSNSSGELLALQESLQQLHQNEGLTLVNIL